MAKERKVVIQEGEGAVNLENDPLSGTDYPYYYGSNASGSISVLGLVFEDPSQPIMLSSYTGNLTTGVTWLTGTLPEPCGTATTFCAEEQSNSVLVKG